MLANFSTFEWHMKVCPTRVVKRFTELTELETLELFSCAKEVAKKLEEMFKFKSFNLVIRDGEASGNRTEHVHIDIVPRDDHAKKRYLSLKKDA